MPTFRMSAVLLAAFLASTSLTFAQSKDLTVQQQLVTEVVAPTSDLKVIATMDHENNTYNLGEAIQLSVTVNADAYLTIVSVGPTGNAVLLYPNQFQPSELVHAGKTLTIPGADAPAQIVATAPVGHEVIRVIAKTTPSDVIAPEDLVGTGAFRGIEGGAERLARDLTVLAASEPQIAFDDAYLTTVAASDVEIQIEDEVAEVKAPVIETDSDEYKIGDTVDLSVTAGDACKLWVVNVSSDKSVHVLFPNKLMDNNDIGAGETVVVSGGDSPVKVAVAGPAGGEAIYALCSEDATPPWQAGLDFSQMYPELDASEGLGKSLIALDATTVDPEENAIPDTYSWSVKTVTVAE